MSAHSPHCISLLPGTFYRITYNFFIFSCVCRELSLDVVPREESGEVINPKDISIVRLYKVVSFCFDVD